MAANVGRWLKYAKAKLNHAVDEGNEELDELEAQRAKDLAEQPWLASDEDSPSFEEAKARIEWKAEEARRQAESDHPEPKVAEGEPLPRIDLPGSAEVAAARLELDRLAAESKTRLEEIREELGVEPPESPEDPPSVGA